MINPICDYCKKELNEFGAILLSPPNGVIVSKFHTCKDCYEKLKPNNLDSEPVAPIDKTLNAEEYFIEMGAFLDNDCVFRTMESFANLRVEQAKEEWEKEKFEYAADQVGKAIQVMANKR